MFRPVTTRTIGPSTSASCGSAARAGGARALDAHPERGVGRDGAGELALAHLQHPIDDLVQLGDRQRNGNPRGQAVGERRTAVAFDGPPRTPRERHHRRLLRDDADAERPRRAARERAADARDQRAVSDGNDDGARLLRNLLQDLFPDRRVALELRQLRPVLEERQPARVRERPRLLLGLVEVGARETQLGAEPLDVSQLRRLAPSGAKTNAVRPSRAAAHAVAAPWLPVDAVTTASAPRSRKLTSAGSAPRHLNEPSSCMSSRFRKTSRPPQAREVQARAAWATSPSRRLLEERDAHTVSDRALLDLGEPLARVERLRGLVRRAGLHDPPPRAGSAASAARTSAVPIPRRRNAGSTASLWMSIVSPSNFHDTKPAIRSSSNAPRNVSPHPRRSWTLSLSGGIASVPIRSASMR